MVAKININAFKIKKKKLKTNEAENWQKIRTASHNSKFSDSYKKRMNVFYAYYFIVDNCDNNISVARGGYSPLPMPCRIWKIPPF